MRVAFVTGDFSLSIVDPQGRPLPGGSGWYRCAVPARYLAANGMDTTVVGNLAVLPTGEIVPVGWDGEMDLSGYDVVVLQRWMLDRAVGVIGRARACGQVVVNDCDDWFDGLSPSNRAFAATHPAADAHANRNHYRAVLAAGDAIFCSTEYLAHRLCRQAPTVVLRNAIDLDRWTASTPTSDGPPVVGWVGATPWRSGDLETLRGVLGPWLRRHGFRFAHHGSSGQSAAELAGVDEDLVARVMPMVSILDYPKLFDGIDIGIVPLSTTPFNEAKSAIKAIEYSAAGIAFVAQATSENMAYHRPSTARRPRDWIGHLDRLADPAFRAQRAAEVAERVKSHDAAARWVDWADAVKRLCC